MQRIWKMAQKIIVWCFCQSLEKGFTSSFFGLKEILEVGYLKLFILAMTSNPRGELRESISPKVFLKKKTIAGNRENKKKRTLRNCVRSAGWHRTQFLRFYIFIGWFTGKWRSVINEPYLLKRRPKRCLSHISLSPIRFSASLNIFGQLSYICLVFYYVFEGPSLGTLPHLMTTCMWKIVNDGAAREKLQSQVPGSGIRIGVPVILIDDDCAVCNMGASLPLNQKTAIVQVWWKWN